jgi:hypothetical protein
MNAPELRLAGNPRASLKAGHYKGCGDFVEVCDGDYYGRIA